MSELITGTLSSVLLYIPPASTFNPPKPLPERLIMRHPDPIPLSATIQILCRACNLKTTQSGSSWICPHRPVQTLSRAQAGGAKLMESLGKRLEQ